MSEIVARLESQTPDACRAAVMESTNGDLEAGIERLEALAERDGVLHAYHRFLDRLGSLDDAFPIRLVAPRHSTTSKLDSP